ncbi:hypothetical protein [Azotobacter vinelandii]
MNYSLEKILELPDGNVLKVSLEQAIATTYESFYKLVENKILDATLELERNKALFFSLSEDQLTGIIVVSMKTAGFDAEHDTFRNGHTDILVKSGRYEWLGEAKLDDGPAYLMEGFRQLSDRYTDGNQNSSRGGLLIYTKKQNKLKLLESWITHISENYEISIEYTETCQETLTSTTAHEHQASGIKYQIRHIPVSLYYNPTDKSARSRKK